MYPKLVDVVTLPGINPRSSDPKTVEVAAIPALK
jgi:hypothetical protein